MSRIWVVMGVSGSGKSSIAEGLHRKFGWPFQEGDELHPKANVDKMRAGIPLDDADRAPWLAACAAWIHARHDAGETALLTCSALKRSYRDILSEGLPDVWFLYLKVPESVLHERLEHRPHHYMPSSLLPTQLATFEEPGPDEQVVEVVEHDTIAGTIEAVIARIQQFG
ncbi:gluconokinase [Lichenicola sp.]|uniref:gluconokinase n=1 Tax=Lichenicola sp. TaxID=2804529 RepID=UPI003B003D10